MNKIQTFQEFLATQSVQVPILPFVFNLILAAFLSFILSHVYIKCGNSLSNRKLYSKNFILMAMTTMLIISIVKSSLALSLGLVGALSIVRFRAAIKEPEELSYLFITIAIGLGMGADQRLITVVAFTIIILVVLLRHHTTKNTEENQNLHLTISSTVPGGVDLQKIVEILKMGCSEVNLKRFDETEILLSASFLVEFKEFINLVQIKEKLRELDNTVKITFLDNSGLIG